MQRKKLRRKARELQEIAGIMQEFGSIPNVIPSELVRNADPIGSIPVASFFVQRFVYVKVCAEEMQNTDNLLSLCLLFCLGTEKGNEIVDYIPGVSPLRLLDLPSFIFASNHCIFHRILDHISWIPKSQYLLLSSIYELESQAIESLKSDSHRVNLDSLDS
ncbi:hypothetical protein D5086_002558 [Populus alba]|uniref:Uncharacterized protein n=1 Tax=Populus alba TaxID=43335 RepID=A0ACC4D351_POPAL